MKITRFDVVEMKDSNKATILEVKGNNKYFAEIVNGRGKTIEKKQIELKQIKRILYKKELDR